MPRFKYLLLSLLLLSSVCFADGTSPSPLNIKTQDGTVNTWPWQLRVTNGTLTDNGDNTDSLNTGGGGGSSTYNNWTVNTNANTFNLNNLGNLTSTGSIVTTGTATASIVYATSYVTSPIVYIAGVPVTPSNYVTLAAPNQTVVQVPSFSNGFNAGSTSQFGIDSSGNLSTSGTGALSAINLSRADPYYRLTPTVGDAFEMYAFGSQLFFTDYTNSHVLLQFNALGNATFYNNITTTGSITSSYTNQAVLTTSVPTFSAVDFQRADPYVRLSPTSGDEFEYTAFGKQFFLSDYTTGKISLIGNSAGKLVFPQYGVGALSTDASGNVSAGTLAVGNGGTGASSASITAFNNITGYTATGATGTTSGKLVFDTSPTFVTQLTTPAISMTGTITNTSTSSQYLWQINNSATTGFYWDGTYLYYKNANSNVMYMGGASITCLPVVYGYGNFVAINSGDYASMTMSKPNGASGLITVSDARGITIDKPFFLTGLGAASAGTAMVLVAGTNEVRPLLSTKEQKDNIEPLDFDSSAIFKLQPVSFNWKESGERDFGLIAEDAYEVLPQLVNLDNGKPISIKYYTLSVLLLDQMKKQEDKITNQQKEIDDLKIRLTKGGQHERQG